MKISDSVMALIGDFAAMKRTPDYVPSAASVKPELENKRKPSIPKVETERRHSLLISVGTQEVPKLNHRVRSESVCGCPPNIEAKLYNKANRRLSAPCISTAAESNILRKKLQKLKEEKTLDSDTTTLKEEDEDEIRAELAQRRISTGSAVYRV
ncbi:unnamed protein product [Cylicocyclus nassatus]|uniref:Uncharacterized protein n=1 Tax=Cylicocyclus nassatus TaxID=53992 RepID=A0AA36DK82_CYLNA|nr:unnamed protein product [Cylicocyclus nassatus]